MSQTETANVLAYPHGKGSRISRTSGGNSERAKRVLVFRPLLDCRRPFCGHLAHINGSVR